MPTIVIDINGNDDDNDNLDSNNNDGDDYDKKSDDVTIGVFFFCLDHAYTNERTRSESHRERKIRSRYVKFGVQSQHR